MWQHNQETFKESQPFQAVCHRYKTQGEGGGGNKCHHNDVIAFIIETMEQKMEPFSTQFPENNQQVNWN